MARSSSKKPGEPKCRGTGAAVEGRDWVRIGGFKWLREVAEQKGKFIPLEYRKDESGAVAGRKSKADRAAEREAIQKAAEQAERDAQKAALIAAGGAPAEEDAPPAPAGADHEREESFLDEAPDYDEDDEDITA